VNGVNYNFGNSLSFNVNANTGGVSLGTISSSGSDINSLVSQYSQYSQNTSSDSTTTQTISSYPSTVVVTGTIPNSVPNTQVLQIATAQSPLGNQAINSLSEYDRNITDLFNQQTQVSQTIANLLEIIRQETANRQQAQTDVNTFTASLSTAVSSQQQISLTISQEEGKVKAIQSAISGASGQLDFLTTQINNVNGQIYTAKANGLALTQQLSVSLNNQNGIKAQITTTTNTITSITASLQSQSQTCSQANQAVLILKGNITSLQNSIAGIDQRVAGIDSDIAGFNAQITALQQQINALNGKIAQSNSDKQALISLNYTVPQQVANINAQIAAQQANCQNTYSSADLTAANSQLTTLQQQLTNAANQGDGISANITAVKGQLTDLLNQNTNLQQQISKTQADINTLKQQLPTEQAVLSKLYLQGNQALQLVQTTNSSLLAAVARYQKESSALTAANLQLQQARTQQQQLSQQINLIIQENSAGLPFPSAPSACGLSKQLAQVNSIDSISLFLSLAYGSGLDFSALSGFSGLKQLYNFASANGSNMRSNCPDIILAGSAQNATASGANSGVGTVSKVSGGNIVTVNTSQGAQTINLDNCTIRLANLPNYNVAVGDVLVWKGPYNAASSSWTASQVTCFH
jgi:predicted  nucleic acid-binding Zn-ribbon protein